MRVMMFVGFLPLALWSVMTVHGSGPNRSDHPRRALAVDDRGMPDLYPGDVRDRVVRARREDARAPP